ncbi:MAG: hypothetical protein CL908_07560 [Deltaproteobacteria bacterium]|nr:hypothetical protein [Deltaproteobacteria bacterium]
MTTQRIYSPEGLIGSAGRSLAASPELLSGRRIAVLDNGKPGAAFLLSELAARLAERTSARLVGVFAKGSAAMPCEDDVLDEIIETADLVLTGTAD